MGLSPAPLRQAPRHRHDARDRQGRSSSQRTRRKLAGAYLGIALGCPHSGIPMRLHRDLWGALWEENKPAYSLPRAIPTKSLSDPSIFAPYSLSDFKTSVSSANSVRDGEKSISSRSCRSCLCLSPWYPGMMPQCSMFSLFRLIKTQHFILQLFQPK